MKKKYLNTIISLVILGVLAGAITIYNKRQSKKTTTTETRPSEKLVSVDTKQIQSFTVNVRDAKPFTLERSGDNWSIVDPQKLPADQSAVTSLLSSLTSATVDEVIDPHPANLKDFGLDSPAATIQLTTSGKPQQVTLLLGDETPTSGGLYVLVSGNPRVVTVASYLKSSLEKTLFDLRDKRAQTLNADQLQTIEVESKGKSYRLAKNPEGVWDLVLPPPVRADRFAVDGLVSQLRSLTMHSIVSEGKKDEAKYGFGAPDLRVKLTAAGATQTITLGKKDGDRYDAINSALDPVFTLQGEFLTMFQKDPADLRERGLFSFSSFEARRLDIATPKGRWVLEQQKEKWKLTAPKAKDEPNDKVQPLLDDLRDLRADSFPKANPQNLAAFGLAKPAWRFEVQWGAKSESEIVEISKVGDHIYARRSTDPLPGELTKTALDSIEKDLGQL